MSTTRQPLVPQGKSAAQALHDRRAQLDEPTSFKFDIGDVVSYDRQVGAVLKHEPPVNAGEYNLYQIKMSEGTNNGKSVWLSEPSLTLVKKSAQLDADSAMTKLAPDGVDLNPPKAHPLEPAVPAMHDVQIELEQLVEVARRIYSSIDEIKKTGDTSKFLDTRLATDPEMWESKAKEIISIKNKLLTALPVLG